MSKRQSYLFLWMLIAVGVFLVIGALILALLNGAPAEEATPTPGSVDQVTRISVEEAKKAFDAGTAIFVDVRDTASYESAHIPGALSIPLSSFSNQLPQLNPSSWIITYCT
jgi:3-mercaptopyruvate sulfurtransferase SseA